MTVATSVATTITPTMTTTMTMTVTTTTPTPPPRPPPAAGPRLYLSTTTMGLSLPVTTISPFQIMSADETIMPKFSTW